MISSVAVPFVWVSEVALVRLLAVTRMKHGRAPPVPTSRWDSTPMPHSTNSGHRPASPNDQSSDLSASVMITVSQPVGHLPVPQQSAAKDNLVPLPDYC